MRPIRGVSPRCAGAAVLALALLIAIHPVGRAGAASDVSGSDAVFAARGVVIVWGVVRGADPDTTTVVMWIASRDPGLRAVAVALMDPAGTKRVEILPPSLIGRAREARTSRAAFAAHPRAELRFAESPEALAGGASALTVSYAAPPETAPEFPGEEPLTEYLQAALARATAG